MSQGVTSLKPESLNVSWLHSILKRICESEWPYHHQVLPVEPSAQALPKVPTQYLTTQTYPLELLGVKATFRSCRIARATCNRLATSKFRAVFAIASIACKDLAKKESCYKAAAWHTACLAKISSHLLRLLANHATGSCLAPTQQVQGKDFTATMTSPIPLK